MQLGAVGPWLDHLLAAGTVAFRAARAEQQKSMALEIVDSEPSRPTLKSDYAYWDYLVFGALGSDCCLQVFRIPPGLHSTCGFHILPAMDFEFQLQAAYSGYIGIYCIWAFYCPPPPSALGLESVLANITCCLESSVSGCPCYTLRLLGIYLTLGSAYTSVTAKVLPFRGLALSFVTISSPQPG